MAKKEIIRMLEGFRQFREKFYNSDDPTYGNLIARPQGPKTLIIGCSDSRVDPSLLSGSAPGEIFVVRNVANLVPPCEQGGGRHGVSAAIEFAVVNLLVENVIVLGHRQCGGIRALLFPKETKAGGFVQQWMKIAEPAKARALSLAPAGDENALWKQCELESIRTSVENLHSFPFVAEAVNKRNLQILGIYFDIERGELLELDQSSGAFTPVVV